MTDDPNSTRHRGAPPPHQTDPGPVADRPSPVVPANQADVANDPAATRYRGSHATPAPQSDFVATPQATEAITLPDRQLDVPVYRLRGRGRWVAAASGAVLVAVGGVVGYVLHTPPATQRKSPASIAITHINAHAVSGDLHCPSAVLQAEATLTVTGGSAQVRYDWLLPTGGSSAPQSVSVSPGATATVTLNYTLSGRGDESGVVSVHVTDPVDVYSNPVPVKYTCP